MTYDQWVLGVPQAIRDDRLWTTPSYRWALYAGDEGWRDVVRLSRDPRTRGLADQLYRALGSISANVAEGFSRSSGADRARYYEYALGSAREARDWYYKARRVIGDDSANERIDRVSAVIRLLLAAVPLERRRSIRR